MLKVMDGLTLTNPGTGHTLRFMYENPEIIAIDLLGTNPDPDCPEIRETLESWYVNDPTTNTIIRVIGA